jgi:hypothetical protein
MAMNFLEEHDSKQNRDAKMRWPHIEHQKCNELRMGSIYNVDCTWRKNVGTICDVGTVAFARYVLSFAVTTSSMTVLTGRNEVARIKRTKPASWLLGKGRKESPPVKVKRKECCKQSQEGCIITQWVKGSPREARCVEQTSTDVTRIQLQLHDEHRNSTHRLR